MSKDQKPKQAKHISASADIGGNYLGAYLSWCQDVVDLLPYSVEEDSRDYVERVFSDPQGAFENGVSPENFLTSG